LGRAEAATFVALLSWACVVFNHLIAGWQVTLEKKEITGTGSTAEKPGTHVLVVEDEPLLQMLLVDMLEEGGFSADTAGSAAEAMGKLRLGSSGVDAVILDIGLPDRPGDELLADLRLLYPALPVVIASGSDSAELRAHFKADRNVSIIGKPYSTAELMHALRTAGVARE
jgi:CheY-like chemotaxis protein